MPSCVLVFLARRARQVLRPCPDGVASPGTIKGALLDWGGGGKNRAASGHIRPLRAAVPKISSFQTVAASRGGLAGGGLPGKGGCLRPTADHLGEGPRGADPVAFELRNSGDDQVTPPMGRALAFRAISDQGGASGVVDIVGVTFCVAELIWQDSGAYAVCHSVGRRLPESGWR